MMLFFLAIKISNWPRGSVSCWKKVAAAAALCILWPTADLGSLFLAGFSLFV
jgi:hypothetical protein